jgi:hypothetical protein
VLIAHEVIRLLCAWFLLLMVWIFPLAGNKIYCRAGRAGA